MDSFFRNCLNSRRESGWWIPPWKDMILWANMAHKPFWIGAKKQKHPLDTEPSLGPVQTLRYRRVKLWLCIRSRARASLRGKAVALCDSSSTFESTSRHSRAAVAKKGRRRARSRSATRLVALREVDSNVQLESCSATLARLRIQTSSYSLGSITSRSSGKWARAPSPPPELGEERRPDSSERRKSSLATVALMSKCFPYFWKNLNLSHASWECQIAQFLYHFILANFLQSMVSFSLNFWQ